MDLFKACMTHLISDGLTLPQMKKVLIAMKKAWEMDTQCFDDKLSLFAAIDGEKEMSSDKEKLINSGDSNDPYWSKNLKEFMKSYKATKSELKKPQDLAKIVDRLIETVKRVTSKVRHEIDAAHISSLAFDLAYVSMLAREACWP